MGDISIKKQKFETDWGFERRLAKEEKKISKKLKKIQIQLKIEKKK